MLTTIVQWKISVRIMVVQERYQIKFQVCNQCLGKRIIQKQSVKPVREPTTRFQGKFLMRSITTVEILQTQFMISPVHISLISLLKEPVRI